MIKDKAKQRFYIPGIISLTVLPFLFYYFGNNCLDSINKGVIQLFWYDPELPKKFPEMFSGQYPPERSYVDISLTGNNNDDSIKLAFSQVRLREILSQQDSINGIHYQFGDSAQYWSFIKALDICYIEQAETFIPYENSLWVYHIPPDTTIQTFVCGTTYTDITPKPSWWTIIKERTCLIVKSSWMLVIGFLILLLSSVSTLLKRWNNDK
jgi:hypothetical protein